ncbi:hypothetical protein [Streptomyces cremeus]|uniref:Uncharacterized protein n=1 Tax=Streptomyces cremeus TaxID=66881 RepID=A0ABV5PIJ8_STRCM
MDGDVRDGHGRRQGRVLGRAGAGGVLGEERTVPPGDPDQAGADGGRYDPAQRARAAWARCGWIVSRPVGEAAAESALHHVAPVGEKEDCVARARRAIGPCLYPLSAPAPAPA